MQRSLLRSLVGCLLAISLVAGCTDDDDRNNTSDNNGTTTDVVEVDDDNDADDSEDTEDTTDASDTDAEDESDADATSPDADVDEEDVDDNDADVEDEDVEEECNADSLDSDFDGLADCEEEQLGTDPNSADSDGDGLMDYEEIRQQTDPTNPDTDGDGAEDGAEDEFDLDPTNPDTYGDGTQDGDRWIMRACDNADPEDLSFERDSIGNWTLGLPDTIPEHLNLSISTANSSNKLAASIYGDPANEVAGFLISGAPGQSVTTPTEITGSYRSILLSQFSADSNDFEQESSGGVFTTHDYRKAARSKYLIRVGSPMSIREFREQLMFALGEFATGDVTTTLPATSGTGYTEFRVFISVILRDSTDPAERQILTSAAIAPESKYQTSDKAKFRMDDMTNTTSIAEYEDGHLVQCNRFPPKESAKAEFYWVLDQSGSMDMDYDRVRSVANEFYGELSNTGLDYRLGVTTMDPALDGALLDPPLWHTGLQEFLDAINQVQNGPYDGSQEFGIEVAKEGLEYMLGLTGTQPGPGEAIRPGAEIITIFMSDEEANTFQEYSGGVDLNSSAGRQVFNNFAQFFAQHSVTFSITEDSGEAYRELSQVSGGSFASLEGENISETIQDIIFLATGLASNYPLPETPISSSLRVFVDGNWIPRSRQNGFDYFSESNSIAFFGDARPKTGAEGGTPENVAIIYEAWLDRTKE